MSKPLISDEEIHDMGVEPLECVRALLALQRKRLGQMLQRRADIEATGHTAASREWAKALSQAARLIEESE